MGDLPCRPKFPVQGESDESKWLEWDVVSQYRSRIEANQGCSLEWLARPPPKIGWYEIWCGVMNYPLFSHKAPVDLREAILEVISPTPALVTVEELKALNVLADLVIGLSYDEILSLPQHVINAAWKVKEIRNAR